jgi:ABC-type nitrate/sulfonate/bicarbonate transport system permease component
VRRLLERVNVAGWLVVLLAMLAAELVIGRLHLTHSVALPSQTLRSLVDELVSGRLSGELATTLGTYVEGLGIAVFLGVAVGVLIGSSRLLRDATFVLVEFLRPIPAVALIPLAILFFGIEEPMRRFVVAYAAVWPVLIATVYGVRGVDRLFYDVAAISGVRGPGRLLRVTLPAALPGIATGVRISATLALVVGITAEFLFGTRGIGAYMQERQNDLALPELYAAAALVALLGYAVNLLLRAGERRIVFWAADARADR